MECAGRARSAPGLVLLVIMLLAAGCDHLPFGGIEPKAGDLLEVEEPVRGLGPLMVPRWRSRWTGDGELQLEEGTWRAVRGVDSVLVAQGEEPRSEPANGSADRLAETYRRTALDLQNQGLRVRGLHVEIEPRDPGAGWPSGKGSQWLTSWLRELRDALDRETELSYSVLSRDVGSLEAEVQQVASSVDWLLVDLYGQRPEDPDDDRLWDLDLARERLDAMAATGTPWRGQIRVSGSVARVSRNGVEHLSDHLPCDFYVELAMRSEAFFQFEGYFRQVFDADLRDRVIRVGRQELSLGDRLRVTRTTPDHLRRLLSSVAELGDEEYLGTVLAGVDRTGNNCLALDRGEIELARSAPDRMPRVSVERLEEDQVRVTLEPGSEPTGVSRIKNNYVDVILGSGMVTAVTMDGFARYQFVDREGKVFSGLRGPGVRLFVPLVEPGARISAEVTVDVPVERLTYDPHFISPTSEVLELTGGIWPPETPEEEGGGDGEGEREGEAGESAP